MIQELFVFYLGEHRVGLPLDRVSRVFQAVEILDLPNAPEVVLGIVNVRGDLVPVVDIRARFGLPRKELDAQDHMVLVQGKTRPLIFLVDSSVGVVATNVGKVFDRDKISPEMAWVSAVMRTIDGVIYVHDLEQFMTLEEEGILSEALKEHEESN